LQQQTKQPDTHNDQLLSYNQHIKTLTQTLRQTSNPTSHLLPIIINNISISVTAHIKNVTKEIRMTETKKIMQNTMQLLTTNVTKAVNWRLTQQIQPQRDQATD